MIIGLTGGIGSGKSTFAQYLKSQGAKIFEADDEAKKFLKHSLVKAKIVRRFGKEFLDKNHQIDAKKLGAFVFQEKSRLRTLENILHPYVIKNIKKTIFFLKKRKSKGIYVFVIPLLFEKKLEKLFDVVIVLQASEKQRIQRASHRLKISTEEVKQRIKHQLKPHLQTRKACIVVQNNKSKKELKNKSKQIFKQWMNS